MALTAQKHSSCCTTTAQDLQAEPTATSISMAMNRREKQDYGKGKESNIGHHRPGI